MKCDSNDSLSPKYLDSIEDIIMCSGSSPYS